MTGLLYLLFFCSGLSGLIYQVVWVRVFGNVFGNTIYSASLVIAVFMLGLGVGSYIVGAWADRRYVKVSVESRAPSWSLLHAYGYFELVIGVLGLVISALLPHLGQVSALVSSYSRDANGWYVLSTASYLARGAIAVILLTPITLLMGGTLTLLIRHLVRTDFDIGGYRIAALYGVNTFGAALGCFLTDFALVPALGLRNTQIVAVFFNGVAAAGALWLASQFSIGSRLRALASGPKTASKAQRRPPDAHSQPAVDLTSLALALSGFAAMGMEILWFRHFSILLGEFRAVFSLLLTVILIGMGAGSLAGGCVHRRTARPAQWLIVVQALFVASTLLGLATADAGRLKGAGMAHLAYQAALGRPQSGWARTFEELWRYMRALAHIPLLSINNPETVLVMCFGVGNTAHAATLHPSVRRVEIVDLSRHILAHSSYFRDANGDVLKDPRVAVYVNDGRQHLQMQREASYDLITLEPPPTMQAGVGALYSGEFYARARTRLKPKGYLSQWLPVANPSSSRKRPEVGKS